MQMCSTGQVSTLLYVNKCRYSNLPKLRHGQKQLTMSSARKKSQTIILKLLKKIFTHHIREIINC